MPVFERWKEMANDKGLCHVMLMDKTCQYATWSEQLQYNADIWYLTLVFIAMCYEHGHISFQTEASEHLLSNFIFLLHQIDLNLIPTCLSFLPLSCHLLSINVGDLDLQFLILVPTIQHSANSPQSSLHTTFYLNSITALIFDFT